MATEGPSSKKRKVLQPTIKCFMNSKHPRADGSETSEEKPTMGRTRHGTRAKTQGGVYRDQPPIDLFMRADVKIKTDEQNENSTNATASRPASKDGPEAESHQPQSEKSDGVKDDVINPGKDSSKMDQAAKLDIKLSPEIILFMKSVCLRHPASRSQADMTLLKMIIDFNPQLRKGDEPLVWIRMQKSLAQMAVKIQEEMQELKRQREAALAAQAAAAAAAQAAAAAAARAAFAAGAAQRQQMFEQMKMQQAEVARRRELMARERELRERNYNQQLYNAVHNVSSSPASQASPQQQQQQPREQQSPSQQQQQQPMSDAQWESLRQSILNQIGQNDKDAGTLVRFIYKNFPPKGKIRIGDDAIGQIMQLQRMYDQDAKKKLKMFLLKVIQDYHPDKVHEELGVKWKTISEDIVKRVTKYYESLK